MALYKKFRESWEQGIQDAKLQSRQRMKDNNITQPKSKRKEQGTAQNQSLFTSIEKSKKLQGICDIDDLRD